MHVSWFRTAKRGRVMALVVVEKVETRQDLADALREFNRKAKDEARRGYAGTRGARYADIHETLDMLLEAWMDADD